MFFSPSYFFEFARKETRSDDASGRPHLFEKERMPTHFFPKSDRVCSTSSFCALPCKRNDYEDTHVHYVVSLFVFVVVFFERTVSRQSYSLPTRLG